jgi:hypothetical protein
MTSSGSEEHATSQDALQDILAALNRVEQLLTLQNQPHLPGPADDGTHDPAGEERDRNGEEVENRRESRNGENDQNGVEEEDQDEN